MEEKLINKINNPSDLKYLKLESLDIIAQQIREIIIDAVAKNGGHLAPNLGTVELSIALHYVFNCPEDKIVWDVGHQAYTHKILTGRMDRFDTLRQYKGLSGFPNRFESKYDPFTVGHSSTAISQALALAAARDLENKKEKIIAVVGDGSLSGGMAFEALNNAGQMKNDLIVVLNDNEMAISKNVGALSDYLNRIITTPIYKKVKGEIRSLIKKLPPNLSDRVLYTAEKLEESLKGLLVPGMLFEELGFFYIGPIDGHNINHLIHTFKSIKLSDGPVLIHVVTKKGKGYKIAEENPMNFHGTGPFNKIDGKPLAKKSLKTFTEVFSEAMLDLAKKDKKLVGITAAMPVGVGLQKFSEEYPDRFFDVGIAEQHAISFAGGLAVSGYKPVTAIYATFLQRAYDQIIHDVCLQKAPVVFAIDRTGLVGEDGPTHHGVFTIQYLRHIPNLVIAFPKDSYEMFKMFELGIASESPCAICYPRSTVKDNVFEEIEKTDIEVGKSERITYGKDVAIFAIGTLVADALDAVKILKQQDVDATLINVRFVKPFDVQMLLNVLKDTKNVLVIEEGVKSGGLGSLILETLEENSIYDINIKCLALPDSFIEHGARDILLKKYDLCADGIVKNVFKLLKLTIENLIKV